VLRLLVKIFREKDAALQLVTVLVLSLQQSAGVRIVVPLLFLSRNVYEMIAINRRMGMRQYLLLTRTIFQMLFICFVLFSSVMMVAMVLGLIYFSFYSF
jgi:hypothetical protein